MSAPIPKANVLIIDKDQSIVLTTTELLKKEGYKVTGVTNLAEALHHVANGIFDIILLDIDLKDVDGEKTLLEFKRMSPHSRIVVLTSSPTVESSVTMMKNGAVDYLSKPLSNEKLLSIILAYIHIDLKDSVLTKLGEKIKSIRKGKGIKIKQLSNRSGLTESSISMIENGKISPSITTINKIASALGVHPIEFFEIERHKRWTITRKNERVQLKLTPDNVLEYTSKQKGDNTVDIYISNLGQNQISYEEKINVEGEKFCLVLKGTVELELGNELISLSEGDSVLFDSMIPHIWRSGKSNESRSLWVVYSPPKM